MMLLKLLIFYAWILRVGQICYALFSRIDTDDIEKMCSHNSKMAATVGRKDLVRVSVGVLS